jgi:hypothetical protein
MGHKRHTGRGDSGQVAMEVFLATTIVVAVASLGWIFTQPFVQGNLYGGTNVRGHQTMGLERTVALPFP